MAVELGELFVEIKADLSDLKNGMQQSKREMGGLENSARALGGVLAAAFSLAAARRVLLMAENVKLLDARLRGMTRSTQEFNRSQAKLLEIANKNGVAYEEVITQFQAMKIAAEELGRSNEDVLQLTDAVNQLGIIGGASAEAMKFSMRQFGQAMAGGIVRAEEFNSIVENTPLLAKAIADGLGVSIGQLRKMVINGEVLSKDVFEALLGQTDAIEKRFQKMPLTTSRAITAFTNNLAQAFAMIDEEIEGSADLAQFIKDASNEVTAFTASFLQGLQAVQAFWQVVFAVAGAEWSKFKILVSTGWEDIVNSFHNGGESIRMEWEKTGVQVAGFWDKIKVTATGVFDKVEKQFGTMSTRMSLQWLKVQKKFGFEVDDSEIAQLQETLRNLASGGATLKEQRDAISERVRLEIAAIENTADFRESSNRESLKNQIERINAERDARIKAAKAELVADVKRIDAREKARIDAAKKADKEIADNKKKTATDEEMGGGTVSGVDKLIADMGNETQAILNALRERNQLILDATKEGEEQRRALLAESHQRALEDMGLQAVDVMEQLREQQELRRQYILSMTDKTEQEKNELLKRHAIQSAAENAQAVASTAATVAGGFATVIGGLNDALAQAGIKSKGVMTALFLAQKAIQVAMIIANTMVASTGMMAAIPGPAGVAAAQMVQGIGFAAAGLVAGLSVGQAVTGNIGGGRRAGGPTGQNMLHEVNEGGVPEVFEQGGRRYLLSARPGGRVIGGGDLARGAASMAVAAPASPTINVMGGGMPSLTVINETSTPVTAERVAISRDEVMIMIKDSERRTVDNVSTSLATGRGAPARGLRKGFNVDRNMR